MSNRKEAHRILVRARRQIKLLLQTLAETPEDNGMLSQFRKTMNDPNLGLHLQLQWVEREIEGLERKKRVRDRPSF
jgi:hypothetical protein